MYPASPLLSIIIVTWNSQTVITRCLDSIFNTITGLRFEVVIVDNASTDDTSKAVGNFPAVKLIQSPINLGFAGGNNLGLQHASGDYILLLNPDAFLDHGSPKPILDYLANHQDIGIIGADLRREDGSPCLSFGFTGLISIILCELPILKVFKISHPRFIGDGYYEVGTVIGAFMLIRKEVFSKVGLLDDNFFAFYEETDFCRRTQKSGYRVAYKRDFQVTHIGGNSFQQLSDSGKKIFFQSFFYYIKKHFGEPVARVVYYLLLGRYSFKLNSYILLNLFKHNNKTKRRIEKYLKRLVLLKHVFFRN